MTIHKAMQGTDS